MFFDMVARANKAEQINQALKEKHGDSYENPSATPAYLAARKTPDPGHAASTASAQGVPAGHAASTASAQQLPAGTVLTN